MSRRFAAAFILFDVKKRNLPMRLIFIRHGDPDYAIDSLTEKGWKEAALLAKRTANWHVDHIYCSPLGRARDTASKSLEKWGREAQICDWLQEFPARITDPKTGEPRIAWDLLPNIWTHDPLLFDHEKWTQSPLMTTGNVDAVYQNVCAGLDGLLADFGYHRTGNFYTFDESKPDTLVFFCHMGITLALVAHLLNIAPTQLWHGMFLAPTSVTVLATEEREGKNAYFRMQVAGDTSHLRFENEPVSKSGYFTDAFHG